MIDRLRRAFARQPEARPAPPREAAPDWRVTLRRRIVVAAACFAVWATAIELKLVYLQVFRHTDLVARAVKQQMRTREIPPKRGDIVDRKGRVLATSVDADSIYTVPSEIGNPDELVFRLCGALGDCNAAEMRLYQHPSGGLRSPS